MDYHSLTRRELQSLCKKHGIPANTTNVQMAASLTALLNNDPSSQPPEKTCSLTPCPVKKPDVDYPSVAQRSHRGSRRPDPVTPLVTSNEEAVNGIGSNVRMTRSKASAFKQNLISNSSVSRMGIGNTDTISRSIGRTPRAGVSSARKGKAILKALDAEAEAEADAKAEPETETVVEISEESSLTIGSTSIPLISRGRHASTNQEADKCTTFEEISNVCESGSIETDALLEGNSASAIPNCPSEQSSLAELNSASMESTPVPLTVRRRDASTNQGAHKCTLFEEISNVCESGSIETDAILEGNSATATPGCPSSERITRVKVKEACCETTLAGATPRYLSRTRKVLTTASESANSNISDARFADAINSDGDSKLDSKLMATKEITRRSGRKVNFSDVQTPSTIVSETVQTVGQSKTKTVKTGKQNKKKGTVTFSDAVEVNIAETDEYEAIRDVADSRSNETSTTTVSSFSIEPDNDIYEPGKDFSGRKLSVSFNTVACVINSMETLTLGSQSKSNELSENEVAILSDYENAAVPVEDKCNNKNNVDMDDYMNVPKAEQQTSLSLNETLMEKSASDGNVEDFIRDTIVSLASKVVASCVSNGQDDDDSTHLQSCGPENLGFSKGESEHCSVTCPDVVNPDKLITLSSVLPAVESPSSADDQCLIDKYGNISLAVAEDQEFVAFDEGLVVVPSLNINTAEYEDQHNQKVIVDLVPCDPICHDASPSVKQVDSLQQFSNENHQIGSGDLVTNDLSCDGASFPLLKMESSGATEGKVSMDKENDIEFSDVHETENAHDAVFIDTVNAVEGSVLKEIDNAECTEIDVSHSAENPVQDASRKILGESADGGESTTQEAINSIITQATSAMVEEETGMGTETGIMVAEHKPVAQEPSIEESVVNNVTSLFDGKNLDSVGGNVRDSTEESVKLTSLSLRKLRVLCRKKNVSDVANEDSDGNDGNKTSEANTAKGSETYVGKCTYSAKAGNNNLAQPRVVGKKPRIIFSTKVCNNTSVQPRDSPPLAKKRQVLTMIPSNVRKTISGCTTPMAKASMHETSISVTPTATAKLSMVDLENLQSPCDH